MTDRTFPIARWNLWPVSIICFFALAIVGAVAFVVFCSRHPADLVAADYYEQEIRYQGQMERTARSLPAANQASITFDEAAQRILVWLPASVKPGAGTGTIHLYRPSALALDKSFALQPDASGLQTIDAATFERGLWKVRLTWNRDHEEFFQEQALVIAHRKS